MKTSHAAVAVASVLTLGYLVTRKPPRKKKTGSGGEGEGATPPDMRRKICERRPNRVWNAKLGRCVLKPKPPGPKTCPEGKTWSDAEGDCVATTWTEVPDTFPPLPAALAAQLCGSPLKLEPELVGTLLLAYAIPAYNKAMGGEIAPSETLRIEGRDRVRTVLREHCGVPSAALNEAIEMFVHAADVLYERRPYGPEIAAETSVNRICSWDGVGTTLDTTQVLSLICDVGAPGARSNLNRDTIAGRMLECSNRPSPEAPTAALALAQALASISIAVEAAR